MAANANGMMEIPRGGLASFLESNLDEIDDRILAFGRGEGINSMAEVAERMAKMGRGTDNYIVHASEREVMVPREVVEKNPELRREIMGAIAAEGADPNAYVIGNDENSINPYTGQREFLLKKIVKGIKKVVKKVGGILKDAAQVVLPIALNFAFPGMGTIAAGALGAGIGTLVQGGNIKDALKTALIGGAAGGLYSGISGAISGQGFMAGVQQGFTGTPGMGFFEVNPSISRFFGGTPGTAGSGPVTASTSGVTPDAAAVAPDAAAVAPDAAAVAPDAAATAPAATTTPVQSLSTPETTSWYDRTIGRIFPGQNDAALIERAAGIQADAAARGLEISSAQALEMARPSALQQFGPQIGLALAGSALMGGFDVPTVEGPTPFEAPSEEDIEARRIYPGGVVPDMPRYTMEDVSVQPTYVSQYARQEAQTYPQMAAKGGEMRSFPRRIGHISGPGTGTSDSVPAMLSDGEFVMTARAVRNAGNGDRQKGVKKMYEIMRAFEGGPV